MITDKPLAISSHLTEQMVPLDSVALAADNTMAQILSNVRSFVEMYIVNNAQTHFEIILGPL
jgi:hypothetical protein